MGLTRYHGKKGVIYGGIATPAHIASLSKWSLDRKTENAEVTSFDDSNKVFVQGLPDISGKISGFWDSADDTMWQGAESSTGISFYLYPSANAATKYWYGPAWLDASISVDAKGGIAIDGTFVAAGAWGRY